MCYAVCTPPLLGAKVLKKRFPPPSLYFPPLPPLRSLCQELHTSDKQDIGKVTIYNVSAMDLLFAVSYWLLAIGTIGAIRVIGSLISNFTPSDSSNP